LHLRKFSRGAGIYNTVNSFAAKQIMVLRCQSAAESRRGGTLRRAGNADLQIG